MGGGEGRGVEVVMIGEEGERREWVWRLVYPRVETIGMHSVENEVLFFHIYIILEKVEVFQINDGVKQCL